ncbi:MAG TPA: CSLREA domain-containing protein, partial [Blastocatellia bacterium]
MFLQDAPNNIIGGTTAAARNVIGGWANGVSLLGNTMASFVTGNVIAGNFIGLGADATTPIANTGTGVDLTSAADVTVGGTAAGTGNVIVNSAQTGVAMGGAGTVNNRVLGNFIYANGGLGIYLGGNGLTANDAGDADAGSNNLQNFPVLNFVTSGGTLGGMLDSLPANTAYPVRIEFFANTTCDASGNGEGETLLGFFSMPAQGFFNFNFTPIPGKPFITATATDANGNTSEFSACRMVGDAPITVNTTADTVAADGFCSLREAIQAANTNLQVNECAPGVAGLDNIIFALGTGTPSIAITGSALPAITEPVNVNGATGGATRVELNGAGAGVAANGLTINAGSSLIASLVINRFTASGIVLQTAGGNSVQGCLIGTDATGATALANGLYGVAISNVANNTIGGVTPGAGNLLSGNTQIGVFITGASANGNVVQGNLIGTNAAGTADLGNGLSGIQIDSGASNNTIGGTTTAARNVISGNDQLGIFMTGANTLNNVIQGNYVGTNAAGTDAIGNSLGGIQTSPNTLVGGTTPGAGNLISGNLGSSNYGLSTESNTTVQGNIIGLNAAGTVALPNTGGLGIGGSNNIIGGTTTAERNIISGNTVNGIVAFPGSGHQISGNYVGVNAAGTVAILNAGEAIILDADIVQVGGMASGAGNLIAGRVRLGTNGNTVQGNFIGTDGTISFNAPSQGILVFGANNLIGGTTSGARNVISGITGQGIRFQGTSAINNLVQGNFIGTNAAGTAALGNSDSGIDFMLGASNNTIGGTDPAARNIISSNGTGITIANATTTGNQVLGNYIGTDVSGTVDLGNQQHGVHIGSPANIIGGTAAGAGNVISGNGSFGIFLSGGGAMNNQVLGNFIGTDAAGTAALPNSSGVSL